MSVAADDGDPDHFLRAGVAFHRAPAAASGNDLYITVGRSITGVIEGQVRSGTLPTADRHSADLHERIARALVGSDPDAAARSVHALFDDMSKDVAAAHGSPLDRRSGGAP